MGNVHFCGVYHPGGRHRSARRGVDHLIEDHADYPLCKKRVDFEHFVVYLIPKNVEPYWLDRQDTCERCYAEFQRREDRKPLQEAIDMRRRMLERSARQIERMNTGNTRGDMPLWKKG